MGDPEEEQSHRKSIGRMPPCVSRVVLPAGRKEGEKKSLISINCREVRIGERETSIYGWPPPPFLTWKEVKEL